MTNVSTKQNLNVKQVPSIMESCLTTSLPSLLISNPSKVLLISPQFSQICRHLSSLTHPLPYPLSPSYVIFYLVSEVISQWTLPLTLSTTIYGPREDKLFKTTSEPVPPLSPADMKLLYFFLCLRIEI